MADAILAPRVSKCGQLAVFLAESPTAGTNGVAPFAPISAVSAAPTIRRNIGGNSSFVPISIAGPIWTDSSHTWPFAAWQLQCGSVWQVAVKDGGSGLTGTVSVTWEGDGGGTELTLAAVLYTGVTGYEVTQTSPFTSTPTVAVGTPAGFQVGAASPMAAQPLAVVAGGNLTITPAAGGLAGCGQGYNPDSPPAVTITGGGGSATATAVVSTYLGFVQVLSSSDDFTGPPTLAVACTGGTPARAPVLMPLMSGASAGDLFNYDAAAGFLSPVDVFNGSIALAVPAASAASLPNYTGRLEPEFGVTPAMLSGVNVGEYPLSPDYPQWPLLNAYHRDIWGVSSGSGVLTTAADGTPISWTDGTSTILRRWMYGPLGQNNCDGMGDPGRYGRHTVVYDDSGINTAAMSAVWCGGGTSCLPVNQSGPNVGTTTGIAVDPRDIAMSGGGLASVGLSYTSPALGTGWQGCVAVVSGGGGEYAVVAVPVSGGVPSAPFVVCGGINYTGPPTITLYGTAVSGTTVTQEWAVTVDPETATTWQTYVFLYLAQAAGTWNLGDPWVVAPDATTGLAQAVDRSNPLAPDGNVLRALTAPNGNTVGSTRWMDGEPGAFNWAQWPYNLVPAANSDWQQQRQPAAIQARYARRFNTDPADDSVAWCTPNIYGGLPWCTTASEPITITATLTAGSEVVTGLSSNALLVGSTVTGAGIASGDSYGLPVRIATIPWPGTTFTLSAPATASGATTLTVQPLPYFTLAASDYGKFLAYNPDGGAQNNLAIQLRFADSAGNPVPHGRSSGMYGGIFATDTQDGSSVTPVGIPVQGAGTYVEAGLNQSIGFVTDPFTFVIAMYTPSATAGLPNSVSPAIVGSTAEIDLMAGGTLPGWEVFPGAGSVSSFAPFGSGAAAAAALDSTYHCNLPPTASDDLVRAIARTVIANIGPTAKVRLEYGNEWWNGGSPLSLYPYMVEAIFGEIPSGTTVLNYTSNGSPPAYSQDNVAGAIPILASHYYDVFEAEWTAAGLSTSRLIRAMGSWYNDPAMTADILQTCQQWGLPVDEALVAAYLSMPGDPSIVAACSPAGSASDAGSLPIAPINDLYRYHLLADYGLQSLLQGHNLVCQSWGQPVAPLVIGVNGSVTATVSGGSVTAFTVVSGGCSFPANSTVELLVVGNGVGAAGHCTTNAEGQCVAGVVDSGGTGYTEASAYVLYGEMLQCNINLACAYKAASGGETTVGQSLSTGGGSGIYAGMSIYTLLPPVPAWAASLEFYAWSDASGSREWYHVLSLPMSAYRAAGGAGQPYGIFGPLGTSTAPPTVNGAAGEGGPPPTMAGYEVCANNAIPNGVPFQYQLLHDTLAHPSARDVLWACLAGLQVGYRAMAGGGLTSAAYYQLGNAIPYQSASEWLLQAGPGQPAGDGLTAAFAAGDTVAWPANRFATIQGGLPADGHDHNGGTPGNTSPALQGLRDWIEAGPGGAQEPGGVLVVQGLGGPSLISQGYAPPTPTPTPSPALPPPATARARIPACRRPAGRAAFTAPPPALAPASVPQLLLTPSVDVVAGESFAGVFRLTLTASSPNGSVDPAVFVHLSRPAVPGSPVHYAQFQKVVTPADLQQLPPAAPWDDADPPWFRLPAATVDFRSRAELLSCQALIASQLNQVLDTLAAMADQVAGTPISVTSGSRAITIQPTAQADYSAALMDGYRITLTVSAAAGLDANIFLCLSRTSPADPGTQYATFQKVAAPSDLSAYPATAPATGASPAWFRVSAITLDFPDQATAQMAQGLVVLQAQRLLDAMALADQIAADGPVVISGEDPLA